MRADVRMHEIGLVPSREKARALIMAGKVLVDGKPISKPGVAVLENAVITIIENPNPYVSRGGLKLKKALDSFQIDLTNVIAADIGASTGGFTDCMLQHGAQKVYALDVGYGQLDWKLRNDTRVVVMERTNARNMQPNWFCEPLEFASIDVSFISIKLILSALHDCLRENAHVVALIKPQFEAGRSEVGKNGVVRDEAIHRHVCTQIHDYALNLGYAVCNIDYSPITGPKGNMEFLILLQKHTSADCAKQASQDICIDDIVRKAHDFFQKS